MDVVKTPAVDALAQKFASIHFKQVELTDAAQVLAAVQIARPQAIIHCAAIIGAATPTAIMRTNLEGGLTLLEAMRMFNIPRMVNLSSEEIYGPFTADTVDEEHPCAPVKPYGVAKLAFEHMARIFAAETGCETIHIRTSWVYGPGLPRARLPKTFIDAALSGTPLALPAGGDLRLDQTYIDDLVAGVLAALDLSQHPYDAYHIASGAAPSIAEIASIVNELVPGSRLHVGPGRRAFEGPELVRKGALNVARARAALGYVPSYPIRAGLAAYLQATRNGFS
jgi:nucleoside-diphosphate-sugar epimerase